MTKGRYDALKALLPPVDSPYDVDNLNAAETAALDEALGDGFGYRGDGSIPGDTAELEEVFGSWVTERKNRVPYEVKGGLLRYSWFFSAYDPEKKYLPPVDELPLKFKRDRLRLYFDNQLDRFRAYLAREEPDYDTATDPWSHKILARERAFTKPWYEFHADRFLFLIDGQLDCLRQWAANPSPIRRGGPAPLPPRRNGLELKI